MKGNLIVVDGSDASGKHTQVERLKDELMKKGYSVKTMDFPRYESFFGKLVSAYLNGDFGDLNNLDPRIPSLFFAMDRFDEKEALNKWLNEGHIVILDRYTESNLGYQAAKIKDDKKREEFIKWIFELENDKLGLPKADLVFYLYLPVDLSTKLMQSRPDKSYIADKREDIHEKNKEYLENVTKSYLDLSKVLGWKVIDCNDGDQVLSKEEITERIMAEFEKSINI